MVPVAAETLRVGYVLNVRNFRLQIHHFSSVIHPDKEDHSESDEGDKDTGDGARVASGFRWNRISGLGIPRNVSKQLI